MNRIRDEVRKVARQPAAAELPEDLAGDLTSPLEAAVREERYERYRAALNQLSARDRELIVARIEAQWSVAEIAQQFGIRTPDAARMAISRALARLSERLKTDDQ
jgi:RNA polymerase sigma factor (sigma-70 family)